MSSLSVEKVDSILNGYDKLSEEIWNIVLSVMLDNNPLIRVDVGSCNEIQQARALARKLMSSFECRFEVKEMAVEIIATVMLHLIYAHLSDNRINLVFYPTVDKVANFTRVNFLDVEVTDFDGNPIYNEETGDVEMENKPLDFINTIKHLLDYEHVNYPGIDIHRNEGEIVYSSSKLFTPDDLKILYHREPNEDLSYFVHPWIYRNFMYFIKSKDTFFWDALAIVPLAIEMYIDKHPECASYNIYKEIENRLYLKKQIIEDPFDDEYPIK